MVPEAPVSSASTENRPGLGVQVAQRSYQEGNASPPDTKEASTGRRSRRELQLRFSHQNLFHHEQRRVVQILYQMELYVFSHVLECVLAKAIAQKRAAIVGCGIEARLFLPGKGVCRAIKQTFEWYRAALREVGGGAVDVCE